MNSEQPINETDQSIIFDDSVESSERQRILFTEASPIIELPADAQYIEIRLEDTPNHFVTAIMVDINSPILSRYKRPLRCKVTYAHKPEETQKDPVIAGHDYGFSEQTLRDLRRGEPRQVHDDQSPAVSITYPCDGVEFSTERLIFPADQLNELAQTRAPDSSKPHPMKLIATIGSIGYTQRDLIDGTTPEELNDQSPSLDGKDETNKRPST